MEFIIRKAENNDIDSIHSLNKESLPLYYSNLEYLIMFLSSSYMITVTEINKKVIAYMIGRYESDANFHILSIAVDSNYRSQGIGKKLLDDLVIKIINKYNSITLYVHTENVKAINFYERNGFIIVETRINYYNGSLKAQSQNAYKMRKNLLKTFINKNNSIN